MKISTELRKEWNANYEHGDFARIAERASGKGEKVFKQDHIARAFRRGAGSDEVINVINDYFQYKKRLHRRLVRQIQTA